MEQEKENLLINTVSFRAVVVPVLTHYVAGVSSMEIPIESCFTLPEERCIKIIYVMFILTKKASIFPKKNKLDLWKGGFYVVLAFPKDSETMKETCGLKNTYRKTSITYYMDHDIVLDKSVISTRIFVDNKLKAEYQETGTYCV